ncbi:hypothetical protein [Tropicimonas aquimaris]|uniref:Uncharacterized protein n=1 Tax=Tropicimonas aquimaris TaxID=914152 RepID=A0ABW3IKU9_9RHOB
MRDLAEKRVTGTVIDRLVRIRRMPMSLDFRPAGAHAMAHGWPELRPGAPVPDLRYPETWQERFLFTSEDGTIEARACGLTPVLGLRFLVPWELVFGRPDCGAGARDPGAHPQPGFRQ